MQPRYLFAQTVHLSRSELLCSELLELQLLLERAGLFFDSARYAAAAENPANLPSISSNANVAGGSSGLTREDPGVPLLAAESASLVGDWTVSY